MEEIRNNKKQIDNILPPPKKGFFVMSNKTVNPKNKNSLVKKTKKQKVSKIASLRTYEGDISKAVKRDDVSIIKMALAEDLKRRDVVEETEEVSKKNIITISLSAIFVLGGILIPTIFYLINQKETVVLDKQNLVISPLVYSDNSKEINITNKKPTEIIKKINKVIQNDDLRLGSIENIYFTRFLSESQKINLGKDTLFSFWETRAPNSLTRSLENDFMLGVHALRGNQGFLILKTKFYENSFAGMLEWEKYLTKDIFNLFGVPISEYNKNFMNNKFKDIIIKNKDARIIKNDTGKTIIVYSFVNRGTIIIATDDLTLEAIISKIN